MTKEDDTICKDGFKWTDWRSASGVDDGNDFERLDDHIRLFG